LVRAVWSDRHNGWRRLLPCLRARSSSWKGRDGAAAPRSAGVR
jgi:hypothetical protein